MACMFTIANFQGVLVDSHQLADVGLQLKLQSHYWRHLRWTKAYRLTIVSVRLYSVLTAVEKHAICYCFSKQMKPKTEVQHERPLRKELAKSVLPLRENAKHCVFMTFVRQICTLVYGVSLSCKRKLKCTQRKTGLWGGGGGGERFTQT